MIDWFQPWMAIPGFLLVHFGLRCLGRSDTSVGRKLRASDHAAWELAVEQKERELRQLLAVEPRGE